MIHNFLNAVSSTISFIRDVKHLDISQWDVEQKDYPMNTRDLRQQR